MFPNIYNIDVPNIYNIDVPVKHLKKPSVKLFMHGENDYHCRRNLSYR